MSLTTHRKQRKQDPIEFLSGHFSQTASITRDTNRQLRSANAIRLGDQTANYAYISLGVAIDYRIRYYFAITPSKKLAAWRGGMSLASLGFQTGEYASIDSHIRIGGLMKFFFDSLDATLAQIQPPGRRLETGEEQLLARYCYVLALLDPFCCGWTVPPPAYLIQLHRTLCAKESIEELLAIPQADWVEDLCAMSWLFYTRCAHILSQPAILNPMFQGSWSGATADLIVGGCLIEVKATINPIIQAKWLRQLARYLLLDYDDVNGIKSVGIYMARQGMLFMWTVEEFLQKLTGDPLASVTSLRAEYRACCSEWRVRSEGRKIPLTTPPEQSSTIVNEQLPLPSLTRKSSIFS